MRAQLSCCAFLTEGGRLLPNGSDANQWNESYSRELQLSFDWFAPAPFRGKKTLH